MELAVITAKQVAVLFLLIFAGFACVKTGAVKMEAKKAFSDLLLYLIVPAMVINSYLTEFDPQVLQNALQQGSDYAKMLRKGSQIPGFAPLIG